MIAAWNMVSFVGLAAAWFVAGLACRLAMKYPRIRWIALWMTLIAASYTMNVVAPPMSLTQIVAVAMQVIAAIGLMWSIWRWRRSHRRTGRHEVEALIERIVADATAFPAHERTEDARKALLESIGNAIDFLVARHANEDYPMQGPGGRVFTWRWQRSEDAVGESLVALTQITYTMLFLGAAKLLKYRAAPDMEFRIERQAMASLMAFIAYQQPVADLLVTPLPYRQSEYREAFKAAWDAIVLPNLICV